MSHRPPYLLLVLVVAACASTKHRSRTPVGANHAPYDAKPEYLGTTALPDRSALQPPMRQGMPVQATPPAPAPVAPAAEEETATEGEGPQTQAPEQPAAPQPVAPQRGGTLTVAPPNEAPLPNRLPAPEQPWQPTIIAPNPPQQTP